MALAGFGNAMQAAPQIEDSVEAILHKKTVKSDPEWRASPLYNIGVEAQETKDAAALLTDRIFNRFAEVAVQEIPEGLPLYIGGGCGLNCDWNARWRDLGHFSSVFVPPCPNDAGSAIGTALDALATLRGDPHLAWSVYSGLEFEWDVESWPAEWTRKPLDYPAIAEALDDGRIFAWVQGRWEIGPRALGNRSILAEPFNPATKVRLNEIKQREDYRPIAPCCRVEDLGEAFVDDHEDPYMLYFNRARLPSLRAVMHVDGSARVQTVSRSSNEKLHRLLTAFAERRRVGVLCNTSLNFKGHGFVNRMSDLIRYCATRGIDDVVVGDEWFLSNRPS